MAVSETKFLNLLDMFDGGGAGRSGDTFEGGGLLSVLANLVATPAGTEQRRLAMKNSTGKAITTAVDEMMRQRAAMMDMQRQRGLQQDVDDPRRNTGTSGFTDPMQGYPDMSMQPMSGVTTPMQQAPAVDYPENFPPSTNVGVVASEPVLEMGTAQPSVNYDDAISRQNRGLGMMAQTNEQMAQTAIVELMGPEFYNLPMDRQEALIKTYLDYRGF